MLSVGSLFSGVGGFDLGFERAGMCCVWQCEIDPYCQRVLEKHWPDVLRVPDIRDIRAGIVPAVDVLCGGFPCQDISLAGKGAGITGARSGLWSEYVRLIGELRPRYVVVENVAALLARGMGVVLGDLATLGYDAEWDCIPASAVGAPHRRDRLWIVAYPDGGGRESRIVDFQAWQPDAQGGGEHAPNPDREGQLQPAGCECEVGGRPSYCRLAHSDGPGLSRQGRPDSTGARQSEPERPLQDTDECALQPWRVGGRAAQADGSEWWSVEPPMGRVAHGVPNRLDQLAALGNALVPQIAPAEWKLERMRELRDAGLSFEAIGRTAGVWWGEPLSGEQVARRIGGKAGKRKYERRGAAA